MSAPSAPGGYFGCALVVDLTSGESEALPLSEQVLRSCLGGAGLGTWLMHRLAPAGVDPLGPDAPLAFVFSPLVGTPLTTSAKFAVVAKSPLTGRLNDALASSHFAIAGKLTGYDAIVVRGECAEPSILLVDRDGARLEPAGELWGLAAADAEERVRARHGAGWRVASIGPAGERLVRFATVSHDGRHAGRGGLGAVLGAKRLKAVAVRGAGVPAAAGRPAGRASRWQGTCASAPSGRRRRSTASSGRSPTSWRLTDLDAAHAQLPGRRVRRGARARGRGAARAARTWRGRAAPRARSAASTSTRAGGGRRTRVEYENVFALGPLCGISDPDAVLAASAPLRRAGLDTISAGGTIAWAMECAERGLIDAPWLRFGDGGRCSSARRRSARARGSATCSPRARAAQPRKSAAAPAPSRRT